MVASGIRTIETKCWNTGGDTVRLTKKSEPSMEEFGDKRIETMAALAQVVTALVKPRRADRTLPLSSKSCANTMATYALSARETT